MTRIAGCTCNTEWYADHIAPPPCPVHNPPPLIVGTTGYKAGYSAAIAECVRRLREHAANDFDTQSKFYYRAAAAILEQDMKK